MPASYDAATPIIAGFLLDLHFNIPAESACHIDAVQCRFLNDRPSFWPRMRKATSSIRSHGDVARPARRRTGGDGRDSPSVRALLRFAGSGTAGAVCADELKVVEQPRNTASGLGTARSDGTWCANLAHHENY